MKKLALFVAMILSMGLLALPAYATGATGRVRDPIISPSREEIPKLPELPDPNEPDSPDIVEITDDDVPRIYYKVRNPETGLYEYLPEEDVPLTRMTSPQTGDSTGAVLLLAVAFGTGSAALLTAYRKKAADGEIFQ